MRARALLLTLALVAACESGGTSSPATEGTPSPDATNAAPPQEEKEEKREEEPPGDGWRRMADAPTALTEVAAAAFGGSVWTAGGLDADGDAVALVQIYDPTFDTWEPGPSVPREVHHAALVAAGDTLYLLGGYEGSSFAEPSAAVHILDLATGQWSTGPPLPEPRAAGAAAWDGQRIVYGGGVGPDGVAADVQVLDGERWSSIGELSEAREHLAAASDGDGRVWFLGGRRGGLDTNLAAVDLVEGDDVDAVADLPTPRGGLAGLYVPGVGACAAGGEAPTGTFAEVECVDAEGTVTSLPSLGEARHGLGAVVAEGVAYVLLGGAEPGLHVTATVEALPLEES